MARVLAPTFKFAPSLTDLEQMGRVAYASLPPELRAHTKDIVIKVSEQPDEETCEELELETPYDILGLYTGVDLPSRSIADTGRLPDIIHLYRRPILDYWCESGEELAAIVRHVLIHEIGHHFGFSDEEMEALEQD